MPANNNYAQWTLAALQAEEKKLKNQEILSALGTGFLIGVMIFGVAMNGFGVLYVLIPLAFISLNIRNAGKLTQRRKEVQAELAAKRME